MLILIIVDVVTLVECGIPFSNNQHPRFYWSLSPLPLHTVAQTGHIATVAIAITVNKVRFLSSEFAVLADSFIIQDILHFCDELQDKRIQS